MNESIETLRENIDAHGLGYAIETGTLSHDDVDDEKISELIRLASESIQELKKIARG